MYIAMVLCVFKGLWASLKWTGITGVAVEGNVK